MSKSEVLVGTGRALVADVDVTLGGTFLHGEIRVNGRGIPLDSDGRGQARLVILPPRVVVQVRIDTPAPAQVEFSVTINGRTRTERGMVGSGNGIVRTFAYPVGDFFPGGVAAAEAWLALDTPGLGSHKDEDGGAPGGLKLGFHGAEAAALDDTGVTTKVKASLTGSFLHGEISVDGSTIALDGDGSGSATLTLTPPNVDVRLLFDTPAASTFEFEVEINGATRGGKGMVGSGDAVTRSFSFPFSAFGL